MKVLIVGLGSIARKHIDGLQSVEPEITIYALRSSRTSQHIANVIDLYSFTDVEKIDFDFVIISNLTSEHKNSIEQLRNLGIPLFIEKPLYHSLAIENLVLSVERQHIITYVACNLRFLDSLRFIKQHIEKENVRINEVNVYCGSYLPEWRKGIDYKKNYSVIPELGGGVHIDLIHEIDYLYWLFGIPPKTTKSFSNVSSLDIRSFDYANYCLRYLQFNASVVLNYYRKDAKRTLEIVSENETINVDLLTNTVSVNNRVVFQSHKRIADTYIEQMNYFIDCVKEKRNTFNTIRDAYNVLQICLNHDIKG
jgi:predicted dehydrogenase